MAETNFAEFTDKTSNDRTFMYVLYGLHTIAWLSGGTLAVIALILNYIKRSDETDPLYASHHNYMISTFWWTVLWLAAASILLLTIVLIPLVFVLYAIIGFWYLYRCLRGIVKFSDGKPPL